MMKRNEYKMNLIGELSVCIFVIITGFIKAKCTKELLNDITAIPNYLLSYIL